MLLEWSHVEFAIWRCPSRALERESDQAFAVIRTPDETTVVCAASVTAPEGVPVSGPWRLFRIADSLPHDAVGILASLSAVLADAAIPIFALSSFDTDYILIPTEWVAKARLALIAAGYTHGEFD